MHEREGGLERIADDVAERAGALHALGDAGRLRSGLWMDEDERLQLLGLLPEWVELGGGDLLALDAAADGGADQAKLLHAALELLGSDLRILQCDRRIADKAARESLAHLRDLGGVQIEHAAGEIAVGGVPERVDAERLHVDAISVHVDDARHLDWKAEAALQLLPRGALERRAVDEIEHGRHCAVRMHVDGPHAAARDVDLAAGCDLRGRVAQATADANAPGRDSRDMA